jgi:amino acid permease
MIGSSMIVFPILFIKDGTIGSLITLMVVCVVQYLTCRLLIIHNRPDEPNFNKQILRILGYKWYVFNSMVNVSLLFFVCIGYYLLIVDNLYMVINALFSLKQEYAAIIATAICLPMLFLKEIDMLLKYFKYTIYCVIAFGVFIAVTVIKEIAEGNIDYSKFKLFDPDFSSVAGTFALSFLIHPVAAPIIKKNVNQDNNKRDLLFGYILTAFIYFFVGFVGSLSCSEHVEAILNKATEDDYSTVFSCFS